MSVADVEMRHEVGDRVRSDALGGTVERVERYQLPNCAPRIDVYVRWDIPASIEEWS